MDLSTLSILNQPLDHSEYTAGKWYPVTNDNELTELVALLYMAGCDIDDKNRNLTYTISTPDPMTDISLTHPVTRGNFNDDVVVFIYGKQAQDPYIIRQGLARIILGGKPNPWDADFPGVCKWAEGRGARFTYTVSANSPSPHRILCSEYDKANSFRGREYDLTKPIL